MKAQIAEAVLSRADGSCEACGGQFGLFEWAPELDHALSRRVPDSADTIWALHRCCHREKTDNDPSADYWLRLFAEHCAKHGYRTTYEKVLRELGWREAKKKAGAA